MTSPVPTWIANRYAVQKTLGEGGFGKTLLVQDKLKGDRLCVLKILSQSVQSAGKEFAVLKSLYHPHIVEVLSCGHLEDKSSYLLLEYVEGEELGATPLADKPLWEVVAQICRALSYIHSKGVAHGDLKPANILLQAGPKKGLRVKLIDFGLARVIDKDERRSLPAGTLAYMAPEVITKGALSPKSDLYALGLILYHLLCGRLPFAASTESIVKFHLHETPPFNFSHPWKKPLEKILRRLLEKDPAKRLSDPLEILTILNKEAGASFEIHRGRRYGNGDEGLFFRKINEYLEGVNQVLRLPALASPKSFLKEEQERIEKYLRLAKDLSSREKEKWMDRLEETQIRLLIQGGRYQEALKVRSESPPVKNVQALARIYLEDFDAAEKILLPLLKSAKDPVDRARAENYLGIAFYNRGQFDRAEGHFKGSLEKMQRLQETTGVVSNAVNLAAIAQQRGRFNDALTFYQEAVAGAEKLHNSFFLATLLSNMANLYLSVGALEEASDHLETSSRLAENLGLGPLQVYNRLLLADLKMWEKDFPEADRVLREAMDHLQSTDSPLLSALAWINYAENAFRAHLKEELAERIPKAQVFISKSNLPEAKFRLEILKIRKEIVGGKNLNRLAEKLREIEKDKNPKEKIQILSTDAQLALAQGDHAACEKFLGELQGLLEGEQKRIPVAYRTQVLEAPLYFLYWEIRQEVARRRESPADASLWKLVEINQRIAARKDPESLNPLILDSAIELTGAERGFLIMPEMGKWKRGTWKVSVARHFRRTDLPGGRDLLSRTIIDRILKSQKPLIVHDAQGEKDLSRFKSVQALRLKSILAAPIVVKKDLIGALYLDHSKTGHLFGERDLELLKAFADQAGIAVADARLSAQVSRQKESLEEAQRRLEEANKRLEAELQEKTDWSNQLEEELKRSQAAGPVAARSPAMRRVIRQISVLAKARHPVLLVGETGTGKDVLAKALHQEAGIGPWVHEPAFNFPRQKSQDSDLMAELFERARGGSLYIEGLPDLPEPYQRDLVHLLKAQEEVSKKSVFVILGSPTPLKKSTSKDLILPELTRFLAGSEVVIPPLRERKEDIGPLVHHLLKELEGQGMKREVTRGALSVLHAHDWPGNVRELKLEIERAAMTTSVTITPLDLSPNLLDKAGHLPGLTPGTPQDLHAQRAKFERDCILQGLEATGWNKARAAKKLGLSRAMLYIKIKEYKNPLQ